MKTQGGVMDAQNSSHDVTGRCPTTKMSPQDVTCGGETLTTCSNTISTEPSTKQKLSMDTASATIKLKQLLRKQTLVYQAHLLDVVHSGDVSELKRFLEQKEGKLNVNWFDKDGQTALHHSCLDGNVELVKVLVKFGADTRLANREGWNPLHIATYGGHKDIVVYLISAHAR